MVLRWWDNREGKVVVGTLPPSLDMEHQVRREMLGGCLAFEAGVSSRLMAHRGTVGQVQTKKNKWQWDTIKLYIIYIIIDGS